MIFNMFKDINAVILLNTCHLKMLADELYLHK